MKKRILINALYPEEKRVAIIEGDTLVDFYVEASGKEHLRGNIYKGRVMRIEPGLQAAFVDFGPKKHGFLQLREISPEYLKGRPGGKRARIHEILTKGQELIVQVEKDERDTKGASLTTYISIPGRYIVMMPGEERVGISRKIEEREERERLKEIFGALKLPKNMGFILRTAGSDKTGEDLSNDLKYLTKLWNKIKTESKKVSAPQLIYKEHDLAVRTVRDYLTSDVTEVLIDDKEAYKNTKEFLKKTVPWRKININLYTDKRPIFSAHNLEEQIAKLNERHVHLPSKGYLVIDKTEALTAVDVNSGRSRKEENVESTALRTNLEAADEIARQFRLRDIGGLVVIDFIDMESSKNRRQVEMRLKDALASDKAHSEVSGISKFGLIELTRERLRTGYLESRHTKCEACGGSGVVKTDEMVAIAAFREMHARSATGGIKGITCKLPVESMNYLINTKRQEIVLIEKEFKVSIKLETDSKLSPGRYEVAVEKIEEEKEAVREEKRPVQPAGHKTEQKTDHMFERKATERRPERSRARGRRRPRYGPKPHAEAEATMTGPETKSAEALQHLSDVHTKSGEGSEEAGIPATEERKAENRVDHEPAHGVGRATEHNSGRLTGREAESKKRSKHYRGRRRSHHGAKTGEPHAAETTGESTSENGESSIRPQREEPSLE